MPEAGRIARWGLIERRTAWTLTWRGRLALLAILAACALGMGRGVGPFLAVSRPLQADYLVVEGWIPDYAALEGLQEFRRHYYERLFTCGGPVRSAINRDPDDTYAHMAAAFYRKQGLTQAQVEPVPAPLTQRDRTYLSAISLRNWFREQRLSVSSLNVVTLGPHARRTRLMYEKAFEGQVRIGVIAVSDQEYDLRHWWRASEGVKEVLSEALAYVYARLLFHPDL